MATTPEPVAIGGAVGALIPLVAGATAVFDVWSPSAEQVTALGALYAGVLVVVTLITRSKVKPV